MLKAHTENPTDPNTASHAPCSPWGVEQILLDHLPRQAQIGRTHCPSPGILTNPPYSSRYAQGPMSFPWHRAGGGQRGVGGVPGRTEAVLGRCELHNQGSAHSASSFGTHWEAHSLAVPGHHPYPCQAPSSLKPHGCTQPSMLRVVAPGGARGGGSGSGQQQAAGGSKARLGTASQCWHSHSLQLSRGLAITRIRLSS